MSGILILVVAVLWLVIAFYLAKVIAKMFPEAWWAYVLRAVLFVALLPLPLIDELVGRVQFEQLCHENSTIQVDRARAAGKTVYLAAQPDVEVKGTWVRVVLQPWRFIDVNSGETIVSYNTLQAVGGVFVRTLGISEGQVPLLFKGSCVPANRPTSVQTFKELGINYVERPAKRGEGK
jgi:hypothetical protein